MNQLVVRWEMTSKWLDFQLGCPVIGQVLKGKGVTTSFLALRICPLTRAARACSSENCLGPPTQQKPVLALLSTL